MFDFRLKVFYTVAKRLNFSKAAAELFISQPAVSKHIKEIESSFGLKLFDRVGNKVLLTKAGEVLLLNVDRLFELHRNMEFEMNALTLRHNGKLKIGASTTIAQYILPQFLASFHRQFKDIEVALLTQNTEQIENALLNHDINLGIIEGYAKNPLIKYTEFLKDELVLVVSAENQKLKKDIISKKELLALPLLLREPGSGTLEVIAHGLKPLGIKIGDLKQEMSLGSTESIKQYLVHSHCAAFLSKFSLQRELQSRELKIIGVEGLSIERFFYYIQLQGSLDPLSKLFIQFIENLIKEKHFV